MNNVKRPCNGSRHAMGSVLSAKPTEREAYLISGKFQRHDIIDGKKYKLMDYSCALGSTHETYAFNPNTRLETLLIGIAQKKEDSIKTIDLDVIPNLLELDILEKMNGEISLAIPFLKKEECQAFNAHLSETAERISSLIGSDLEAHLRANKIETPDHVWDYLEYMKYFCARDALEMLYLLNDSLYPIHMRGEDGKFRAPAMILCEE